MIETVLKSINLNSTPIVALGFDNQIMKIIARNNENNRRLQLINEDVKMKSQK